MCPREPLINSKTVIASTLAQRGFALVSAIFLLVVLAALGAAMLVFSSTQHASSAMDIQGARAYHAARAGIEWGAYQVLRNNGNCVANPTANPTFSLAEFSVAVDCTSTVYGTLTTYQITSTASSGTVGQLNRVERQLQATVSK